MLAEVRPVPGLGVVLDGGDGLGAEDQRGVAVAGGDRAREGERLARVRATRGWDDAELARRERAYRGERPAPDLRHDADPDHDDVDIIRFG